MYCMILHLFFIFISKKNYGNQYNHQLGSTFIPFLLDPLPVSPNLPFFPPNLNLRAVVLHVLMSNQKLH